MHDVKEPEHDGKNEDEKEIVLQRLYDYFEQISIGEIKKVREAVQKNRATLILGAGSSASAGIPGWDSLLSQILGYAMQYSALKKEPGAGVRPLEEVWLEQELILNNLNVFLSSNYLEAGQYMKQLLESTDPKLAEEHIKTIIACIIEQAKTPEQFLSEKAPERRAEELDEKCLRRLAETETLPAVAYLLKKTRRAITYDYHTLIQDYLIDVFQVKDYEIVTHPGYWNDYDEPDKIQVFHVHGFIPHREKMNCQAYPKEAEKLILSEDSYKTMEQVEEYNWANSVQSYYLNRDHCIFIGFSGDDYNFRRMIRQIGCAPNRPEHYLFFAADKLIRNLFQTVYDYRKKTGTGLEEIYRDALCLIDNILKRKQEYWEGYNIIPIWTTVEKIPQQLISLV